MANKCVAILKDKAGNCYDIKDKTARATAELAQQAAELAQQDADHYHDNMLDYQNANNTNVQNLAQNFVNMQATVNKHEGQLSNIPASTELQNMKTDISGNKTDINTLKQKDASHDNSLSDLDRRVDTLENTIDMHASELPIIHGHVDEVDAALSRHIESMNPVLECVSELDNAVNDEIYPRLVAAETKLDNMPSGGVPIYYDEASETLTIG